MHLTRLGEGSAKISSRFIKKPIRSTGTALLTAVNAVSRISIANGRPFVTLDEESLIAESRARTGLYDFGDESFRRPLGVLLKSFENDADLNLVGRITVHSEIVRMLSNRLLMEEDRRQDPRIADERILRPIFITGLPRSGTTFLHALLAQDPRCRAPQVWELMRPSPPPETATYGTDPRIAHAEKQLKWADILMPDFGKFHLMDARYPQECIAITDHAFMSYLYESMYHVPSYRAWHDAQDKRPAYLFHKRFLQHLQCRCPGTHWVLKAPSHLMALEALLDVYPDADIVVTHRDPLKVLASCSSLKKVLNRPFTNRVDTEALRTEVNLRWEDGMKFAMEFRERNEQLRPRFHDVFHTDLIRDPVGVVREIYRFFDRELTPEAEESMRRFAVKNPKNNGLHHYSLEEFGFDRETERRRFQFYTDYYGILPEG